MSEYMFGLGPGHLGERARKIAKTHGVELVNYTEPRGEKRHWFAGPNRGAPFDERLARDTMTALEMEGTLRPKR